MLSNVPRASSKVHQAQPCRWSGGWVDGMKRTSDIRTVRGGCDCAVENEVILFDRSSLRRYLHTTPQLAIVFWFQVGTRSEWVNPSRARCLHKPQQADIHHARSRYPCLLGCSRQSTYGAINSHKFFEFIVYGTFMSSWLILFAIRSSALFDEKCVEIVKKIRVASWRIHCGRELGQGKWRKMRK